MRHRLAVRWLLLRFRLRDARRAMAGYRAAAAAFLVAVAVIAACGFVFTTMTARQGACYRALSQAGGRPHWLTACQRRQP